MSTKRPRHTFTEDDRFALLFHQVRPRYALRATDSEVVRELATLGAQALLAESATAPDTRREEQRALLAHLQATFDLSLVPEPGTVDQAFGPDDWDE